jgi:hypothetical protein
VGKSEELDDEQLLALLCEEEHAKETSRQAIVSAGLREAARDLLAALPADWESGREVTVPRALLRELAFALSVP